jgi:hypothetical protein
VAKGRLEHPILSRVESVSVVVFLPPDQPKAERSPAVYERSGFLLRTDRLRGIVPTSALTRKEVLGIE